jgi:hypothetical protein
MSDTAGPVYCIDSSSLIACERNYPIDIFPGVWAGFDTLVTTGRLISHEEVWLEFSKKPGFLVTWAARWKAQLCVVADPAQVVAVRQIAMDFPLANYTTIDEHRADPWMVALARTRSCCVVSQERGVSAPYPKIPQMCQAYGIDHKPIFELMRAERWTF